MGLIFLFFIYLFCFILFFAFLRSMFLQLVSAVKHGMHRHIKFHPLMNTINEIVRFILKSEDTITISP